MCLKKNLQSAENDKQVLENHVKELTGRFSGGIGGGKDDAQLRSQILALTRKVPVYLLILWSLITCLLGRR